MVSEYYIDANFLVYYFLPDSVATSSDNKEETKCQSVIS